MKKNKLKRLSIAVCCAATAWGSVILGMEDNSSYYFSPPAQEAKYLHVTVKNCSEHNNFQIDGINMSGGLKHRVPADGTIIPPRATAGLVFKQNDSLGSNYGPEAHITISGKGGVFTLYAQQNYCLLAAGNITAKYSYNAHYKDVEGGCAIDGGIKTQGTPLVVNSGAYGASYGRVAFELLERRKGEDGKAPANWNF